MNGWLTSTRPRKKEGYASKRLAGLSANGQSANKKTGESSVTAEIQSGQPTKRPYEASYFLPGKLAGRPVHYLLDTGCTTNLLGKHVFDKLPPHIRSQREECDSHGVMADGTQLLF